MVSCQVQLQRAADNGASFRQADGLPFKKLETTDVDYVLVPLDYTVSARRVRINGSQQGRSRNGGHTLHMQYVAGRRYLWSSCVDALLDSDDASIDDLAFRKQHAVYGLQDETRPHRRLVNDWIIKRPPGWQEPSRRRGARRGGAA